LGVKPTPDATDLKSIAVPRNVALPIGKRCLSGGVPGKLTPADVDDDTKKESGPCIAFVEYDAEGNPYKAGGDQIGSALALVHKAIEDDPQHQPIIVGFVHGWKHNANPGNAGPGRVSEWPPEDGNIQGLEHVLNFLYRCYYADPNSKNRCLVKQPGAPRGMQVGGHVVVGIYFGWYGADISEFWPFAQTISVYSRGGEADKVASAQTFSHDLERLSEVAHQTPKPEHEPLFVLVGHSFGARLLEQAITKPLEARIAQEIADPSRVPTFADLVLYINSAAPAEDGMDMLQFLATQQVLYSKSNSSDSSGQPLLASITTPADAATGVAFTAAMTPISWAHGGKASLVCFDPDHGKFPCTEDKAKLYRNTLGHLQEFQSHSVNEVPNVLQNACKGGTPGSFLYWVPGHCFHVIPAPHMTGQQYRWNGTPYWVMSTNQVIIPDHGTIFTNRFLRFVGHMLPNDSDKAIVTGKLPSTP